MPFTDRYEIEVMKDRTAVLHDRLTGQVIMTGSGFSGFNDCLAERQRLENEINDSALWDWIKE